MNHIFVKIQGVPYGHSKVKGNINAPEEWTERVVEQTKDFPKVTGACLLRVTFLLPPEKFPSDLPFGPDLDNLAKRFLDALNRTIFSEAPGKDSCVIALHVMKSRVDASGEGGALLEVLPLNDI